MEIIAALCVENISLRQAEADSTRIDLTGIYFSVPVRSFPTTIEPHIVILVHCPPDHSSTATLEVTFRRGEEEVARIRQPFMVEPGKFGYRLVKGELEFEAPDTIEAHCTIEGGDHTVVVPISAVEV